MINNRCVKIIAGGFLGGFIGSSIGITAMGTAIAGTIPLSILGAYFVYLWTRNKVNEPSNGAVSVEEDVQQVESIENDPLQEIEQATSEVLPILIRILVALWNLSMKGMVSIGVMPIFKSAPWLFVVLMLLLMVLFFPVGVLFFFGALVAMSKNVNADNDFII